MVFIKHNSLKLDIHFNPILIPYFLGSKFLRVQIQVLAVALISSKTEETKNSQIKGEQHLIELNKTVVLISEKFDEYEKVEKEIIMKEMQKEMKCLPATI